MTKRNGSGKIDGSPMGEGVYMGISPQISGKHAFIRNEYVFLTSLNIKLASIPQQIVLERKR